MSSTDCHLKDFGVVMSFLVSPFVENLKTPQNSLTDVFQGFFFRVSLGMASGDCRTAHVKAAVLRVYLQNHFENHWVPLKIRSSELFVFFILAGVTPSVKEHCQQELFGCCFAHGEIVGIQGWIWILGINGILGMGQKFITNGVGFRAPLYQKSCLP